MVKYSEYIFQQLITTEFIQNKLVHILISITTNIINLHLVTILCMFISFNPIIDFIIHTSISVGMALNIDKIYNLLERYTHEFTIITNYLIKNYSIENYCYWKRLINLIVCGYICIILLFVEINNWFVFTNILYYVICFLITEQFEQKNIQKWIKNYKSKPIVKINCIDNENIIINSYITTDITSKIYKRNIPVIRLNNICSGSIVNEYMK